MPSRLSLSRNPIRWLLSILLCILILQFNPSPATLFARGDVLHPCISGVSSDHSSSAPPSGPAAPLVLLLSTLTAPDAPIDASAAAIPWKTADNRTQLVFAQRFGSETKKLFVFDIGDGAQYVEIASMGVNSANADDFLLRRANGTVEWRSSRMSTMFVPLPGLFSELSATPVSLCAIPKNSSGWLCWPPVQSSSGGIAGQPTSYGLATEQYRNIVGSNSWICAIRVISNIVDCYASDSLGTNPVVAFSSTSPFAIIAPNEQLQGFCGLRASNATTFDSEIPTIEPEAALWCVDGSQGEYKSVEMSSAPAGATQFLRPVPSHSDSERPCVIADTGDAVCGSFGWDASNAAFWGALIDGAGGLIGVSSVRQRILLGSGPYSGQADVNNYPFGSGLLVAPFLPLRYILVDPVRGNDADCSSVDTSLIWQSNNQTEGGVIEIHACATIKAAWSRVRPNTWIHLNSSSSNGVFTLGGAVAPWPFITISSQAPTALRTLIARTDEPRSSISLPSATLDCEGEAHCIESAYTGIVLSGLAVSNSQLHAVASTSASDSTYAVTVINCTFIDQGGVLSTELGSAWVDGVIVSHANPTVNHTQFDPMLGLVNVVGNRLVVMNSAFEHNNLTDPPFPRRAGCIHVYSSDRFTSVELHVSNSRFSDNHLRQTIEDAPTHVHGAAVAVNMTHGLVLVRASRFEDNTASAFTGIGAAMSVMFQSFSQQDVISVKVDDSIFARNTDLAEEVLLSFCTQGEDIRKVSQFTVGIIFHLSRELMISDENADVFGRLFGCVSGGGGGLAVSSVEGGYQRVMGAIVSLSNTTFIENRSYICGGAMRLGELYHLTLSNCTFEGNSARIEGGAFAISRVLSSFYRITYDPLQHSVKDCDFRNNFLFPADRTSGVFGGADASILSSSVDHYNWHHVSMRNSSAIGASSGGSLLVQDSPDFTIEQAAFEGCRAAFGGCIHVSNTILNIGDSSFNDTIAWNSGGAIYGWKNSQIYLEGTLVANSRIVQSDLSLTNNFVPGNLDGGFVYSSTADVFLTSVRVNQLSMLPPGGLEDCPLYEETDGSFSGYRGMLVFANMGAKLQLRDVFVENAIGCHGSVFVTGMTQTDILQSTFLTISAYSAAGISVANCKSVGVTDSEFISCNVVQSAAAIRVSHASFLDVEKVAFRNCRCTHGDGVAMWTTLIAQLYALSISVEDCSAPEGAGLVLFTPVRIRLSDVLPYDRTVADINITYSLLQPPTCSYGEYQASDMNFLSTNLSNGTTVHSGITMDPVYILARDLFGQPVRAPRSLVIRAQLMQKSGDNSNNSNVAWIPARGAKLTGTLLQGINSSDATAVFDDLAIISESTAPMTPYFLHFSSIVGSIYVVHRVNVDDACPAGLHFDQDHKCIRCPADFLVYEPSVGCVPCPTGYSIHVTGDASVCGICPAGSTSAPGGDCLVCGANTYQPAPGLPCVSCLDDDLNGLKCENTLPVVREGWFAYSVADPTPRILTAQCPEQNFCSGGPVQSSWTDPLTPDRFTNGSAFALRPQFSSAVTRYDQCAWPRRSSPDNLLCGQCVEGFVPWGDKCSECTEPNGPWIAGLFLLSLLLVAFLIRSAAAAESAGHSVVGQ